MKKRKVWTVFAIIFTVIAVIATVFSLVFSIRLKDALAKEVENLGEGVGMLAIVIVFVPMILIASGISLLFLLPGGIISIVYLRKSDEKKYKILYKILIAVCAVCLAVAAFSVTLIVI